MPRVAWAFSALYLLTFGYNLTHDGSLWQRKPWFATAVLVLALLLLASMVIWRQRWAWWLSVVFVATNVTVHLVTLGDIKTVAEWVVNVVFLGLLLSPQMRRYVGVRWRGRAAPAA